MNVVPWASDRSATLLTDLHELSMLQAYYEGGMHHEAVFNLCLRRLPNKRNYLLACGLDSALACLEHLTLTRENLDFLAESTQLSRRFLSWLEGFQFEGDVYAVPEGTPVFGGEPILEIVAPIAQAQLIESCVINQIRTQTIIASRVSRMVTAARGRGVVDFGTRRPDSADAALKAVRAGFAAGMAATSNLLAGRAFGIPVMSTMTHSYVLAHEAELVAFQTFVRSVPNAVLLVDTYEVSQGVRHVVELSRRLGRRFAVQAVCIESGDLEAGSREARMILNDAGLQEVAVFVGGNLDEFKIAELAQSGAPIDGFGVATGIAVEDEPAVDFAYQLACYRGCGTTPGVHGLPGRKQVFRQECDGEAERDVIARPDEQLDGRRLLRPVMVRGKRLSSARVSLAQSRAHREEELCRLPQRIQDIAVADIPYSVELSDALHRYVDNVRKTAQTESPLMPEARTVAVR